MKLTDDQIEAIREEVAHEPETSPARRLLAHLDAEAKEAWEKGRERLIAKLVKEDGFTLSEATRTIDAYFSGGVTPEFDYQALCPVCEGTGCSQEDLFSKCSRCLGSRTIVTYKKLPADTRFERVAKDPGTF